MDTVFQKMLEGWKSMLRQEPFAVSNNRKTRMKPNTTEYSSEFVEFNLQLHVNNW